MKFLLLLLTLFVIQLYVTGQSKWSKQKNVCIYKKQVPCRRGRFRHSMCERKILRCCPGWDVKIGLHSAVRKHFRRMRYYKAKKNIMKTRGCQKKVGLPMCISLPQRTPRRCKVERKEKLQENQKIYYLTKPTTVIPDYPLTENNIVDFLTMPMLNKTFKEIVALNFNDTLSAKWALLYTEMIKRVNAYSGAVINDPTPITSYQDYADLLYAFREVNNISPDLNKYFVYPAKEGLLKDIVHGNKWKDDQIFAEQKLAGGNPFIIRRLRRAEFSDRFLEMKEKLDEAVKDFVDDEKSMNEMIQDGLAYIVDFPLLHDLTDVTDITNFDKSGKRTMRGTRSPIAFFISMENTLKPIAIKVALKSTEQIYTPNDGAAWLLAKEEVQRAEFMRTQIVEHLLRTHLTMEPICTALERTLSKFHPLHEILKWHCMGIHLVNSNGLPVLLAPGKLTHLSFSIGHTGSIELLNKAYDIYTWKDLDFKGDLKRRGVDDPSCLPYYPYRDDGILIWRIVRMLSSKYVNLYYRNKQSVQRDYELQNFVNEISSDGIGKFGGVGMVKGFPSKLNTKSQVIKLLTRILFLPIQHHAVNYPVSYYGGFVPNTPSKLYDDARVPEGEFGFYSLPHRFLATVQGQAAMTLGSIRYDKFLDYGSKLKDKAAQRLVQEYFQRLHSRVKPILEKRNRKRLQNGHLSYPYYLPQLLPNGIQT